MAEVIICDECSDTTPTMIRLFLQTGRVIIDGKDVGQNVDLCFNHAPILFDGDADHSTFQPWNCKRVQFHWTEGS